MTLAPHAMQLLTATSRVNGEGRILSLFGHQHAATSRFAVLVNETLVYDSYSWGDPRWVEFDTFTRNPTLAPKTDTDGAFSGVLSVHDGDAVRVQCEVYNASNFPMTFGSDLRTQEMCVLLLSATGSSFDPPLTQVSNLPP